MKLTKADRAIIKRITENQNASLKDLVRITGLNPATDLIGGDFRNADFGTEDLGGYNLSRCDLRGAKLHHVRNFDRAIFADVIEDAATTWPSRPRPGQVLTDGPGLPELVVIPAGSFLMGVPPEESLREKVPGDDKNARPQRSVTIARPFCLGRYPVTRGEFAAFATQTNRPIPSKAWTFERDGKGEWNGAEREGRNWRNPGFEQTDRDPVVCVSHDDASDYVAWLSKTTRKPYRLPSEAEWEYAARAGTTTARFWGDDRAQAVHFANVSDETLRKTLRWRRSDERFFPGSDGFAFTSPVGAFRPNGFGLNDMLGNVWEWVADPWHDSYDGAPSNGSLWTTGGSAGLRVLRGGSWDDGPGNVRAGARLWYDTGSRDDDTGFRVARTL